MKFLTFTNTGLLDVMGLLLMGASTKRDNDNKIGEYGTGWKYALAALYRNGIDIKIYVNGVLIPIETETTTFSGKEFKAFKINGENAYFTTDMGPDWKLWMAIREIYCNCLDEKHPVVSTEFTDKPENDFENKTIVKIPITEEIENIIDSWMDYFSFERTDIVLDIPGKLKVFKKLHNDYSIIYRKGIKVAQSRKKGCYDYDFERITINEIRESDLEDVKQSLETSLLNHFNSEVISGILELNDCWEKEINFYSWQSFNNRSEWNTALSKKIVVPSEHASNFERKIKDEPGDRILKVPSQLAQLISIQVPEATVLGMVGVEKIVAIQKEMSDQITEKMLAAFHQLDKLQLCVPGEYLFEVCQFSKSYVKATHDNKTISINIDCENWDVGELLNVMVKEILLIKYDMKSMTREFEDKLVNNFVDISLSIIDLSIKQH